MHPAHASALEGLNFARPPVAVAFASSAPEGLPRIDRSAAAGCAYWKHASDGHAFYTTADDHSNCPVGAYTHGVDLAPALAVSSKGGSGR
jgi:uncharacterized protein (DUF169 family)